MIWPQPWPTGTLHSPESCRYQNRRWQLHSRVSAEVLINKRGMIVTQALNNYVISGPVTGGKHGWPFAASMIDVEALGYEEAE